MNRLPGPWVKVFARPGELDAWKGDGQPATAEPAHRHRPLVLLAVLAIVGLVMVDLQEPDGGPLWLEEIRPLTTTEGLELHPNLSPDDTQFAFVQISPGRDPELYLQNMATGSVQPADSVLSGTHARWSLDSSLLAYSRSGADGAAIVICDKTNHQRVVATLRGGGQ